MKPENGVYTYFERGRKKEIPVLDQSTAEWFGGTQEVGGTSIIAVNLKGGNPSSAYPSIELSDTKPRLIVWLRAKFNNPSRSKKTLTNWRIEGYRAAAILLDAAPYALSRRELVQAVSIWWEADSEERIRIAQELKGYNHYSNVTTEEYLQLILRPAFVAGVLDCKGMIYPHVESGHIYPRVNLNSKNIALLEALKRRFGGSHDIRAVVGSNRNIDGHTFVERRDSYTWSVSNRLAREYIEFILPFLVIAPYEGWDKSLEAENKK